MCCNRSREYKIFQLTLKVSITPITTHGPRKKVKHGIISVGAKAYESLFYVWKSFNFGIFGEGEPASNYRNVLPGWSRSWVMGT